MTAPARAPDVAVFHARCEDRAEQYALGKLDLHGAVDGLQRFAETRGLVEMIGQDAAQAIMADAFRPWR